MEVIIAVLVEFLPLEDNMASSDLQNTLFPFIEHDSFTTYFKWPFVIMDTFVTMAWTVNPVFLAFICIYMRNAFWDFNNQLQKMDMHTEDIDIKHLRGHYENLIRAVNSIEGAFSAYVGINIAILIPFLCFQTYNSFGPSGVNVTFAAYLLLNIIFIGVVFIPATMMHEQVTEIVSILIFMAHALFLVNTVHSRNGDGAYLKPPWFP